jgi:hypothetical protein
VWCMDLVSGRQGVDDGGAWIPNVLRAWCCETSLVCGMIHGKDLVWCMDLVVHGKKSLFAYRSRASRVKSGA